MAQSFSVVFLYWFYWGFNNWVDHPDYTEFGSDDREDLQAVMRRRKQKRMQSNRESARRSRMRKQKHLDELAAQVSHLTEENGHVLMAVSFTTQQLLAVEAENTLLRAQAMELSSRLHSLNQILCCMNDAAAGGGVHGGDESYVMMMRPLIMASEDMVQLQYLELSGKELALALFVPIDQWRYSIYVFRLESKLRAYLNVVELLKGLIMGPKRSTILFVLVTASILSTSFAEITKTPSYEDEVVVRARILKVQTNDYGSYDPSPSLEKPPFKLIPN
uniref:BZIP domain-containing protein n=1 Tax=Ananas comosus var. bracteatus TaxID=296719 RepID=A0A6V7QID7_ANACO|nr:unnamed protein product [Ananas comosus var. bracteatus]